MSNVEETVRALAACEAGYRRHSAQLAQLEKDLGDVAKVVADLAGPGGDKSAVVSTLDHPHPAAAVADLLDWLARVYLAYDGATLPACWAWHPGVVEELTALRAAHHQVYASADWVRILDWHDRMRPGVVRRIEQALMDCHIGAHRHRQADQVVPLGDALYAIAEARAAERPVPAPTEEQIQQARQHEQQPSKAATS